jgi:hypothetical protein
MLSDYILVLLAVLLPLLVGLPVTAFFAYKKGYLAGCRNGSRPLPNLRQQKDGASKGSIGENDEERKKRLLLENIDNFYTTKAQKEVK